MQSVRVAAVSRHIHRADAACISVISRHAGRQLIVHILRRVERIKSGVHDVGGIVVSLRCPAGSKRPEQGEAPEKPGHNSLFDPGEPSLPETSMCKHYWVFLTRDGAAGDGSPALGVP
jgi:hypothetical protein